MATITFQQAICDTLRSEMERDKSVFIAGIDVRQSVFGITAGLVDQFGPERVLNTCISESAIAGVAMGAAMTGMRPVAEIMFSDFMYLAMDAIANQAGAWRYVAGAQVRLPMVIRTSCGGGMAFGYNHSQCTETSFMGVPGVKIAVPSTPADAAGLIRTAIRDDNPVLFYEHKALFASKGEVPDGDYAIPFGAADVKRSGKDVTVVAVGFMVHKALAAAETLSKEGIEVEVIDPRTIKPLDMATILDSVQKTGRLVTVEESRVSNGFGAELSARIMDEAFDSLDAPVQRVGAPDLPIPYSPGLEKLYIPDEGRIVEAVKKALQ